MLRVSSGKASLVQRVRNDNLQNPCYVPEGPTGQFVMVFFRTRRFFRSVTHSISVQGSKKAGFRSQMPVSV